MPAPRGRARHAGNGPGRAIRCPYHGWTYDCEGRLARRAPEGPRSLARHASEERAGLRWLAGTTARQRLEGTPAGALAEELEGLGLAQYHHHCEWSTVRAVNWKIAVETFLEFHHIPALHAQTSAPAFIAHASTVERFGPHLRLAVARTTIGQALEPCEGQPGRHFTVLYLLFPRTMLVMHSGQAMLFRISPHESDPGKSEIRVGVYTPQNARNAALEKTMRDYVTLLERTLEEDFAVGESIQRNARANSRAVWTHTAEEPGLQRWHASLEEAITRDARAQPSC